MKLNPVIWQGLFMIMLSSCAGYNRQAESFYSAYSRGDYEQASSRLDKVRLLRKDRNRLLYLLEKGKVEYMRGNAKESNRFFNDADALMSYSGNTAGDVALSLLLNPMAATYRGEAFERYLIHYYKALNYLRLNNTEDALVEARRISLRTGQQEEAGGKNDYKNDAFSMMLQGLIYEKAGDWNNAFIAYRNAYEVYDSSQSYYGVKRPLQLEKDLLHAAWKLGFQEELKFYEEKTGLNFNPSERSGREAVVFWEQGLAPVKVQQDFFFSPAGIGTSDVYFTNNSGYRVPFQGYSGAGDDLKFLTGHTIRVAYPRYQAQPFEIRQIEINGASFEKAQDVEELAVRTLDERKLKELSVALSRQALKIIAAEAAKAAAQSSEKEKDKNAARITSAGIDLFRLLSEKADTRNWQSLPQAIFYTRVALDSTQDHLDVHIPQGGEATKIPIPGNQGLIITSFCTR